MGLSEFILIFLLLCSTCLNVFFFKQIKTKSKEMGMDARRLLNDLTRGAALVRVIPIDPEGLFTFRR